PSWPFRPLGAPTPTLFQSVRADGKEQKQSRIREEAAIPGQAGPPSWHRLTQDVISPRFRGRSASRLAGGTGSDVKQVRADFVGQAVLPEHLRDARVSAEVAHIVQPANRIPLDVPGV